MLANTLKMERGKKSDKKRRDAHTFKAEQETLRAKEVAEYTERKKRTLAQARMQMSWQIGMEQKREVWEYRFLVLTIL